MAPVGLLNVALVQTHGYLNQEGGPPWKGAEFLQLLRFADRYDVYLGGPPIWFQELGIFLLSPTARLLGFKGFYPEFALKARRSKGAP